MQNFCLKTLLAMAVLVVAALASAHAQEKPEIFVQIGHSAQSVAFSSDGRIALSGGLDHTLKLWDISTGKCIRTFEGHSGEVLSVAFSPDRTLALSGSNDKTLKLWEISTGKCIRTFKGHSESVQSVVFSPDGTLALSGSSDKTLKLWNITAIECIRTFIGHSDSVGTVAFSPDGRIALSGGWDDTMKLWDISTGNCIRTFTEHKGCVRSIAFSPDGRLALSGSFDETLKLWEISTGKCVRTFTGHKYQVNSVAFSLGGTLALSGSVDHTLKLWEVSTGKCVRTLDGHSESIDSVAFSPDGTLALSGSDDNTLKLCEISTGKCIRTFKGHKYGNIESVAFSPDGTLALSGGLDYTPKLWDISTGKCVRTLEGHSKSVNSVVFSPDGTLALSGSNDHTLKLWEVSTGKCIRTFSGHLSSIQSVAFNSDGRLALSGSFDKTLKLWDISTGRCVHTFAGHSNTVNSVAFSLDGRLALSGSTDTTIRIWSLKTGKEIAKIVSFDDGEGVVITPEGYYNASPNGDKYLNVRMGNNVYGIDQYKAKYFRPDIVQLALQLGDTQKAIAQLKGDTEGLKASEQPPKVWFVSPQDQYETDRTEIQIQVKTEDIADEAESVTFYVNGRPLSTEKKAVRPVTEGAKVKEFSKQVPLVLGNNFIEAEARGKVGATQKTMIVVIRKGSDKKLPALWYFGAGVSEHSLSMLSLRYAAKDVSGLADALKLQKGRAYSDVNIRTLTDAEATRGNIMDGAESFFASAKQEDVAILFVSGHGMNSASGYYFIAHDSNPDKLSSTGVSAEFFSNVLKTVKCSVLLFADTCHSGNITGNENWKNQADADPNEFLRGAADNGVIVFSSSSGSSISREDPSWGHGAFAKALIDGIMGEAAFMENKVDIASLQTYVKTTVLKLTDNTQQPVIPKLTGAGAFLDLVLAKKES